MNLLFICTKNQIRSLTAERIFKNQPGYSVRSAGTESNARNKISGKMIVWADLILVMEKKHQEIIRHKFPTQSLNKKIICLNIPDQYQYMDDELVEILKEAMSGYLNLAHWPK